MSSPDLYDAAHQSAVLFDEGRTGTVAVSGADRASFLHALLTNDVAGLEKGKGVYAAYLTPQGRMITDLRVVETGSRMLVGVERAVAAPLAARLESLIFSEDVQARDASAELAVIGVHGPSAAAFIRRAVGLSVVDLAEQYDNVTADSVTVVRDDALGVLGFDVYTPVEQAAGVRAALASAGAAAADGALYETLRLEAGRPRFGVDMDTDTIPLEAGLESRAISFTKGCYVGQEVIVRVKHRGHGRVARRLVSIVFAGGPVPAAGAAIFAGEREVGRITSAVESPKQGSPLALGLVQRDHAAPGTELRVDGSQARVYQPVD